MKYFSELGRNLRFLVFEQSNLLMLRHRQFVCSLLVGTLDNKNPFRPHYILRIWFVTHIFIGSSTLNVSIYSENRRGIYVRFRSPSFGPQKTITKWLTKPEIFTLHCCCLRCPPRENRRTVDVSASVNLIAQTLETVGFFLIR
jgi:hypothetical protein